MPPEVTSDGFDPTALGVDESSEEVSPETPDTDEAIAEESEEQTPEVEAEVKPPKGFVPEKDLRAIQSAKDKEVAEAKRQNQILQTRLQETDKSLDELAKRLLEIETRDMPADEAAIHKERYEVTREKQKLAQEKAELDRIKAERNKEIYATNLAVQYKISKDELMEADSPYAMELLAKKLSEYQRRFAKTKRAESGVDRLDTTVTGSARPSSLQEARRRYIAGDMTDAQFAKIRRDHGIDD